VYMDLSRMNVRLQLLSVQQIYVSNLPHVHSVLDAMFYSNRSNCLSMCPNPSND
jgi:hypothetical protein